jgi:hypothetical protein
MITSDQAAQDAIVENANSSDETVSFSEFQHLRPCSPPEILNRAFQLVINHFPLFGLLALLAAIPSFIQPLFPPFVTENPDGTPHIHPGRILLLIAINLVALIPSTALVAGLFLVQLRPQRALSAIAILKYSLSRWPQVVLAQILLGLMLGLLLPLTAGLQETGGLGSFLGTLINLVALYWAIRLILAWPILIIEGRNILQSLRRSLYLTKVPWKTRAPENTELDWIAKPLFSRSLLLMCVPLLCLFAVSQALTMLVIAGQGSNLIQATLGLLTTLLFTLLLASGTVALYTDCLVRVEAWDLENRIGAREIADQRSADTIQNSEPNDNHHQQS